MSGYHYYDQSSGKPDQKSCFYVKLSGSMTESPPLPRCLNRKNGERSSRDIMDYNFYVLGKPMNLPAYGQNRENFPRNTENFQKHS